MSTNYSIRVTRLSNPAGTGVREATRSAPAGLPEISYPALPCVAVTNAATYNSLVPLIVVFTVTFIVGATVTLEDAHILSTSSIRAVQFKSLKPTEVSGIFKYIRSYSEPNFSVKI
jgi:hypothetical protein